MPWVLERYQAFLFSLQILKTPNYYQGEPKWEHEKFPDCLIDFTLDSFSESGLCFLSKLSVTRQKKCNKNFVTASFHEANTSCRVSSYFLKHNSNNNNNNNNKKTSKNRTGVTVTVITMSTSSKLHTLFQYLFPGLLLYLND